MRIKTIALLALMIVATAAAPAVGQTTTGFVTVVHGIPGDGGFPVDVYVNGDLTLESFTFETVTDALELPAADYDIEIFVAGSDPATSDPALADTVTLPAGASASIIAHLTETGDPTLSVFVNDVSNIAAGETRVTVRHTAAAPTVDVLANDGVLIEGLSNPDGAAADVPADSYNVKVVPTGATEPVVFEADLDLAEGTSYIAYAIGSLDGDTFTVALQTITGLETPPAGVPSGTGGSAASDASTPALLAMLLGGLFLVGLGGRSLARSRA
jgi:hypothetical protein